MHPPFHLEPFNNRFPVCSNSDPFDRNLDQFFNLSNVCLSLRRQLTPRSATTDALLPSWHREIPHSQFPGLEEGRVGWNSKKEQTRHENKNN